MSVKKDPAGRRSVQVETEVSGTPEEIWEVIASAEGISSWFVPTRLETDAGGKPARLIRQFGPGMESAADVTAWDAPKSFAAESKMGPGGPTMLTEWIVEGRSGGTCVVRVVHSLFASTDDWDDQLESIKSGWPGFFAILRSYLAHFRGQRCSSFNVMSMSPDEQSAVWRSLTVSLGLANAAIGSQIETPADAPRLAGVVESIGIATHPHGMLLRLNAPAPGLVSMSARTMGGKTFAMFSFYFYGESAMAAAAKYEPVWTEWMSRQLQPAP